MKFLHKKIFKENVIVSLVLIYFIFTSVSFLDKIGFHIDEGIHGNIALDIISGANPYFSYGQDTIDFHYCGFIPALLLIPLFLFFGCSVFVLRLLPIIIACGAMISIYYVCRKWFGTKVGLVTLVLLASNSVFIRAVRVGLWREEIFQIFFLWVSFVCLQRYLDTEKKEYLYLIGLLFGVALNTKIMFLGYLAGIFVSFLFVKDIRFFVRNVLFKDKKDYIYFLFMFIIGISYWITYNIVNNFAMFKLISDSIVRPGFYGLANNMIRRVGDFCLLLLGSLKMENIVVPGNFLNFFFFFVSFIAVSIYLFCSKKIVFLKNKIAFLFILYIVLFFLTGIIPNGYNPENIIILMPFVEIIQALFIVGILNICKNKKYLKMWVVSMLIFTMSIEMGKTCFYINMIKNDNVEGSFSPVINEVASYLETNRIYDIINVTNYIGPNIEFLTMKRVSFGRFIYSPEDVDLKKLYYQRMNNKFSSYFITCSYSDEKFLKKVYFVLTDLARRNKKELRLVKSFEGYNNFSFNLYCIK